MVRVQQDGDTAIVSFSGPIDEDLSFDAINMPASFSSVVIDLGEVTLLNSLGLRSWLTWIRGFAADQPVVFRRCTLPVVQQMNVLQGFFPRSATVESFEIPYFCEDCEYEEIVLAQRGRDFKEGTADSKFGVNLPRSKSCPECGGDLDMDIIGDSYFKFLQYRP